MIKCLIASLFASIGCFLFGYHAGIISGSALFIVKEFHLTIFQESLLVSLFLLGAIFGAFGGGALADFFGRRKTMLLMALLFLGSGLYMANAQTILALYAGRALCGIAVGIASAIVPTYIAEVSPVDKRGTFVCIAQVMIVLGVLASFLISWVLCPSAHWRGMFFWSVPPALLLCISLFFLPDSIPVKKERGSVERSARAPLFIGSFLNVLQQVTGINIIICFTPRIFQLSGLLETESAIAITVWIGVVNVAMTLLGLLFVDRVGRRPFALFGFGGMAIALCSLSVLFWMKEPPGFFAVANLILFIGCFAIGPGLVTSLICSEISPPAIRGRAMGLAMFSNWSSNLAITAAFLPLAHHFGVSFMFLLFGLLSLVGIAFVWTKVPETKGKTFEEIGRFWQK